MQSEDEMNVSLCFHCMQTDCSQKQELETNLQNHLRCLTEEGDFPLPLLRSPFPLPPVYPPQPL